MEEHTSREGTGKKEREEKGARAGDAVHRQVVLGEDDWARLVVVGEDDSVPRTSGSGATWPSHYSSYATTSGPSRPRL